MSLPSKDYEDDAPYVCTLDAAALKKAKEELYEDPNNREDAIKQLREWIKRQPHLRSRTDNYHLIRFLRGAKFSQLRAREMLEGYYGFRSKYPKWCYNIDTRDPKIHYILDKGYLVPLPGKDKEGRRVMLQRTAALPLDDKSFDAMDLVHTQMCLMLLMYRQEDTQVHGSMMFGDHTGATIKHMMRFPIEDMKAFMKSFQKSVPGRFKAFHVYNAGAFIESMMAIMKPIMSSKFLNRMVIHSTLESVYKHIPMEMLPVEYLPDDYKGPNAGTIKQLCDEAKKQISTDEFNTFMKYESSDRFGVDESKRPKEIEGAFRKLNVD